MDNVISIMITGAGAPGIAGTIYALKESQGEINYRIITIDIKNNVIGKYLADGFYTIPCPESKEYLSTITDIAIKEKIKVILPQTTREIIILSRFKDDLRKQGIEVVVSDYQSILVANDKFLVLEKADTVQVPFPIYRLTSSEEEFIRAVYELGYPEKKVVIKPRLSNGMRGIRILTREVWDVKKFLNVKPSGVEVSLDNILPVLRKGEWPELLVTEYLEGDEYTIDVFRNFERIVVIPRIRKQIRSGITFDTEVDLREDLIEYSRRLAEAIDLRYCFGFQFKMSAGVPKLLECNPRVQGTMVVSMFAGFNIIENAVKEAVGIRGKIDNLKIKDKIQFKRYWGGVSVIGDNFTKRI